jgi:Ni/Co efflux regulator RcnB
MILCQTMKKLLLILAVAAFTFSPLMVSQAEAGTGKHAHAKHHTKHHHGKHHHGKHQPKS